jgi:hypothetical protein
VDVIINFSFADAEMAIGLYKAVSSDISMERVDLAAANGQTMLTQGY